MKKSEMIEALANETGLTKADAEKMFNATFNLVKEELAKEIDMAYSQGINATPSTKIGKDVYIGIKPYSQLKKLLEDAGATPR